MSLPPQLALLPGDWTGHNHLYLPEEPVRHSAAAAVIDTAVSRKFLQITYTWHFDDLVQEGLLLLSQVDQERHFSASWADSWHMNDELMALSGSGGDDNRVTLRGSYTVPGYPAWGWRIDLLPAARDQLLLTMHNVTPEGEELLAVEMTLQRRGY